MRVLLDFTYIIIYNKAVNMKGYLWKTNIEGYEDYSITIDQVVNENTAFFYVERPPEKGIKPGWGVANKIASTELPRPIDVLEKGLEIERVDYNRASKNTVVLKAICDFTDRYWYSAVTFEVEYASADFVPNSPGATYEFRCPWGTEKFVVGQTYHFEKTFYAQGGDYTFNGEFGVDCIRDKGDFLDNYTLYLDVFILPAKGRTPATWAVVEQDGMFSAVKTLGGPR